MRRNILPARFVLAFGVAAGLMLAACSDKKTETAGTPPEETRPVEKRELAASEQATLGRVQGVVMYRADAYDMSLPPVGYENYAAFDDNPVKRVAEAPVSTFSIDVDTGSYANLRRFLMNGQKPPADAVRVEEMLNYFTYDYPAPADAATPFRAEANLMTTPWNPDTRLLRIGIKGYQQQLDQRPPANLVFLIDVSGSMQDTDKLPLLKAGMKLLVDQLRADDRVSIVTYAGAAGLALPPTPGAEKGVIRAAIDALEAGGSTAGGEGIVLAYGKAREAMIKGGINRILLATDGDFNVGITDIGQLKSMIEQNRDTGIALSTLGFGEGNYNDALMEQIADVGNGNYGYIDSLKEAKRQLIDGLQGNLQTIAKDVKIQIEFNPAVVAEYRLIGYENRALNREDFNNDRKDAGEIGSGHTVTALYEIALVGGKGLSVDPLRYQNETVPAATGGAILAEEFALLRLRYKEPDGEISKLIETPLPSAWLKDSPEPRGDDKFAAAVAAFGQYLRDGEHLGKFGLGQIAELARGGRGEDSSGYRAEFIEMVQLMQAMDGS